MIMRAFHTVTGSLYIREMQLAASLNKLVGRYRFRKTMREQLAHSRRYRCAICKRDEYAIT